jgi:hypothetical protein
MDEIRTGTHAVEDLSIWMQVLFVAAAALLGPAAVFSISLSIAVLLRATVPTGEPPAVVLVAANRFGRLLLKTLRRPPRAAVELPRIDIVRPSPGSLTGPAPRSS